MNLTGTAFFTIQDPQTKKWHQMSLKPGDIVVFNRQLRHGVAECTGGPRINVTVRYARPDALKRFKHPSWYAESSSEEEW